MRTLERKQATARSGSGCGCCGGVDNVLSTNWTEIISRRDVLQYQFVHAQLSF